MKVYTSKVLLLNTKTLCIKFIKKFKSMKVILFTAKMYEGGRVISPHFTGKKNAAIATFFKVR